MFYIYGNKRNFACQKDIQENYLKAKYVPLINK